MNSRKWIVPVVLGGTLLGVLLYWYFWKGEVSGFLPLFAMLLLMLLIFFSFCDKASNIRVTKDDLKLLECKEMRRQKEEEYQIVIRRSGKMIVHYDLVRRALTVPAKYAEWMQVPEVILAMPEAEVMRERIAPEHWERYLTFFDQIHRGDASGDARLRVVKKEGKMLYIHITFDTLFDLEGKPMRAVIAVEDITQERVKEMAYEKWTQSIAAMPYSTYVLLEYNLTQNLLEDVSGYLFDTSFLATARGFDEAMLALSSLYISEEDRKTFFDLMKKEELLRMSHQGIRFGEMDFRICDRYKKSLQWVHLDLQMIVHLESGEMRAYLMFIDINQDKKERIELKLRTEEDVLTKAYNREAFIDHFMKLLSWGSKDAQHAIILLDIDDFKLVNDSFGHQKGDEVLVNFCNTLHSTSRQSDLVGRLGGDEFVICLANVPYDAFIIKRVDYICQRIAKASTNDISITASIGVAIYPRDGANFEELYQKADEALYRAKALGKNRFVFASDDFLARYEEVASKVTATTSSPIEQQKEKPEPLNGKKRMLLLEDEECDQEYMEQLLGEDYLIHRSHSSSGAYRTLKHYSSTIKVAMVNIESLSLNGLGLIKRLRDDKELMELPIIAIGDIAHLERSVEAIQVGATDFVTKPFIPEVVQNRIKGAISRMENDKLRMQNAYCILQKEEEEKYRQVLIGTGTVVFEIDWLRDIYIYDSMVEQYLAGTYDGRSLWKIWLTDHIASADDVRRTREMIERLWNDAESSSQKVSMKLMSAGGEWRWYCVRAVKIQGETSLDTCKILLTLNDIHEDVIRSDRLQQLAQLDSLTGLFNRTTFSQRVREMLAEAFPGEYVIIYMDIDRFKVVNDLYGYAEGDRLLLYITRMLQTTTPENAMLSRIASDYFVVCMPYEGNMIKKLKERHEQVLEEYELPIELQMTYGIYVVDDVELNVDSMIDRAALAHHTIKGSYLRRYAYYDETIRMRIMEEQEIVGSMNAALEQEQFKCYLQPQVDYKTGQIVGAEALVRWVHPERGIVSPGTFIPLFENNGFITKLDIYMCEKACEILQKWDGTNLDKVPISINISRADVYHPQLFEIIWGLTQTYGVTPERLRFEITESAYMESPTQLISLSQRLKSHGFVVEMDDFGSGFSSLNALKDVPVDVLKLDMKFLEDNGIVGKGGSILSYVIGMAGSLDMQVIAEGVETREQADSLLSRGCNQMQGYYFAKPKTVREFEEFFDEYHGKLGYNKV